MGFQNKNQAAPLTDLELETKKEQLLEDLQFIARKIEEAQAELAEHEYKANKLVNLDEVLEKKQTELTTAKETLAVLRVELEATGEQLAVNLNQDLELSQKLVKLRDEVTEIEQATQLTLDKLEAEVKEKTKQIEALNKTLESKTKLCDLAEDEIRDNQVYLEEQEKRKNTKVAEVGMLVAEVGDLNKTLDNLGKEINEKQDTLAELLANIVKANLDLAAASVEATKIVREADEYKAKVEADLVEREGVVSIKESWLKEKEDLLKQAKDDLEKYYNRPINHVKF